MKDKFDKDDFLARWLKDDLTKEELQSFKQTSDFETFKMIAELSSELKPPELRRDKVWGIIDEQTKPSAPAKIRSIGRWWRYAAAAAVAVLLGYLLLFQNQLATFSTPMASQETLTLPDGSKVTLNALSKITFDNENFLATRTLNMEGEAFFDVKEGSRFLVETQNGFVQVKGTSFNVFSRKNRLNVTCYTGSVGVYFQDSLDMQLLQPADQVIALDGAIISLIEVKDRLSPEWSEGSSRFYLADMSEVVEELERQYDVKITYHPDLAQIKDYNGGFPHRDLKAALQVIFGTEGYQFEIDGRAVRVYK